jgi:hypothetical protein
LKKETNAEVKWRVNNVVECFEYIVTDVTTPFIHSGWSSGQLCKVRHLNTTVGDLPAVMQLENSGLAVEVDKVDPCQSTVLSEVFDLITDAALRRDNVAIDEFPSLHRLRVINP